MEGELIIVSIISLAGAILISTLYNRNWFKRENFKINIAAEKLKLKKLAKDLDIAPVKTSTDKGLIELLGNLDKDKIAGILDMLQSGSDTDIESDGIENVLMNFASKNPELVKNLINGLGSAGANPNNKIPIESR